MLLGAVSALGFALAAAQNSGAEVRIEARRLGDGRVEFALSERGTDGEWGDRVLPSSRYFPAGSRGGWLRSSPVSVGASAPAATSPSACADGAVAEPDGNPGLAADGETLLAVRGVLAGDGKVLNWSAALPMDQWEGVTIGGSPPRVAILDLHESGLSGSIPPELGGLANLQYLYLRGNELSGSIPPELGGLANLEALSLSGNELTGCLPRTLRARYVLNADLSPC